MNRAHKIKTQTNKPLSQNPTNRGTHTTQVTYLRSPGAHSATHTQARERAVSKPRVSVGALRAESVSGALTAQLLFGQESTLIETRAPRMQHGSRHGATMI